MSDIQFQYSAIPNRYKDQVQRYAVMYPLQRPVARLVDVYDSTQAVVNMWRARIGTLTAHGWLPNNSQYGISYARNCRPTFAMSTPPTRTCRLRSLCPFCYARWVRQVWMKIDADLTLGIPVAEETNIRITDSRTILLDDYEPEVRPRGRSENYRPMDYRFHLVERHHYTTCEVAPEKTKTADDVVENLMEHLMYISSIRAIIVNYINPVGAFSYTTCEPRKDGTEWRFHHRQLFKISENHELPDSVYARTKGTVVRHERPTRKNVMKAVARVCRYPTKLMRGDVERTMQYLEAKKKAKYRSNTMYRSFRNVKVE